MNYRTILTILISLIIGSLFGIFAKIKFIENDSKKLQTKTKISQLDKIEKQEKIEKIQDVKLTELDESCSKYIVSLNPLIVKYAMNATCNCDSAYKTLDLNFCSGIELCIERKRFYILNSKVLKKYDSLIAEQNQEIENAKRGNDSIMLREVIDFKTIKQLHVKSIKMYLEYLELETEIRGVKMGISRNRIVEENNVALEILKKKNIELTKLIGGGF